MKRVRWAMGRGAPVVLALGLLAAGSCLGQSQPLAPPPAVVPLPAEITPREGAFLVDGKTLRHFS
jgi:hypothetical protein